MDEQKGNDPEETKVYFEEDQNTLICTGAWTLDNFPELKTQFAKLAWPKNGEVNFNGEQIKHLDSAGAWLLIKWKKKLEKKGIQVNYQGFPENAHKLLKLITKETAQKIKKSTHHKPGFFASVGKYTIEQLSETQAYLAFIGQLTIESIHIMANPRQWRWKSLASTIYTTGFLALPIIAVLSFMIGVVLTYQMGLQLNNYGANIFIVDLLGLAVLREFAPLLTAIMIAGRSGSAYTASLGMMKLNQEIDALDTLGVTSSELLLLPKIMGLVIALPLLTIWADLFGVFGGMVMANRMLDISWYDFMQRFPHVIPLKTFLIGMIKAPIFALLISSIGCFQGMQVSGGAESIGKNTTRSVVLSIFFIIIADAIFSILLSNLSL